MKETLPADLKTALVWVLDYFEVVHHQTNKPDLLPLFAQCAKARMDTITAWLDELHRRYEGVPEVLKANRRLP